MTSGQVETMTPIEAFWHERFGAVILFRVTCVPSIRDYVHKDIRCAEDDAKSRSGAFIRGFTGSFPDELPPQLFGNLN